MRLWRIFGLAIFFVSILKPVMARNCELHIPDHVHFDVDGVLQAKIFRSLDELFVDIENDIEKSPLVRRDGYLLNIEYFKELAGIKFKKGYPDQDNCSNELINIFEIAANQYMLKVAYIGHTNTNSYPVVNMICSIAAYIDKDKITFSSPLSYRTKDWERKQIGSILYHYKGGFDVSEAKAFERVSVGMANSLGLTPLKLEFYKCDNFQEVLSIIGFDYDLIYNGKAKESWIIGNTIFQGFNNEKFSHDIFHVYTSKIVDRKHRNWTAEEGIAYSWGDAYYPKRNGEIITRDELMSVLVNYLEANPDTDLLGLFENRTGLFSDISPRVKVKSVISSLICDEVQKQNGNEGIIRLITCGKGDDKFFGAVDELIGLNRSNFNREVMRLIEKFD